MSRIVQVAGLVLLAQMCVASPSWSVQVGEPIPNFGMQTFAGGNINRPGLAGKPALLVFWNTWCSNCLRELPRISQLAEKFAPKGLAVVAINTGLNDSESKARAYWKKFGYLFPVGFDRSFEIGQSFRVMGVPTVVLVDAKGIVRYNGPGIPDNVEERLGQLTGK